jgi:hypothetical protein
VPNDSLVAERDTVAAATPVPLSAIDCGDPAALSVMVMAAVNAPEAKGPKWPWMVQFAPAASVVPQLFAKTNEDAFAPVRAMLVMDSVASPELVRVSVADPLVLPTFTLPNESFEADRDTNGTATPVPLSAIDCGDPAALSVMVMAAVSAPEAKGPKCPWIVQFAPAARVAPQLFAKTNEDAFVPVTAMLVIDNVAEPLLVSVTVCDPVIEP